MVQFINNNKYYYMYKLDDTFTLRVKASVMGILKWFNKFTNGCVLMESIPYIGVSSYMA